VFEMPFKVWISSFAIIASAFLGNMAYASSITEDLADCAQGVAIDSILKAKMAVKAAEFAAYHSDCIPLVSATDPILIGMTGGILGLQANNSLARDSDVCTDQIFSVAQRPIAGMIDTTMSQPGLSSIVPASSRNMLREIANGQAKDALYSVPGMTVITSRLTCGCAVAETGVPVEALKETVENGLKTINSCSGVVTKLLGGAYTIANSGAEAALAAATKVYNTAKDAIKSMGCGWLWSCPSPPSGPPFFCTGYNLTRAQGGTVDGIRAQYAQLWDMLNGGTSTSFFGNQSWISQVSTPPKEPPPNPYDAMIDTCEAQHVAELDRITKDLALADAAAKAEAEGSNYALAYFIRWLPECKGDQLCSNGLGGTSNLYYDDLKDPDIRAYYGKNSPDPFRATVLALNDKYRANAQILVWGARDRRYAALRNDANAAPKDRLIAFGCNPFLGRDRQSLCTSTNNMDVCKQYVNAGKWNFCVSSQAPGAYFSAGRPLTSFVQMGGCVPINENAQRSMAPTPSEPSRTGIARLEAGFGQILRAPGASTTQMQRFQCLSPSAWRTCRSFQNGGSLVDCGPSRNLTLAMRTPIEITPIGLIGNPNVPLGVRGLGALAPPVSETPFVPGLIRRLPPSQPSPPQNAAPAVTPEATPQLRVLPKLRPPRS
jgi:hypothetical protein